MKLVLAMVKHETNTFSPLVTDFARFEAWGLYTGQAAIDAYGKTNMPLGVYLNLAKEYGADEEAVWDAIRCELELEAA